MYLLMENCRRPGAVDPTASTAIEIPPVRYGTKKPCQQAHLGIRSSISYSASPSLLNLLLCNRSPHHMMWWISYSLGNKSRRLTQSPGRNCPATANTLQGTCRVTL